MSDNRSSDERRRKLTARIAQEEQRISELNTELEQLCALVQELKNGTDKAQTPDNATSVATALGRGEKMRLFRTLFRGREDAWDLLLCRWAVKALAAMRRKTVAIRYVERIVDRGRLMGSRLVIGEQLLLSSGSIKESYQQYGLRASLGGTYLATFRAVADAPPARQGLWLRDHGCRRPCSILDLDEGRREERSHRETVERVEALAAQRGSWRGRSPHHRSGALGCNV